VTHDPRIAAYADRILRASVKDGVIVDEMQLDAQYIGNVSLVADKITTISREGKTR
jgi:ABC-type lipoprotein export system ATPase subunit